MTSAFYVLGDPQPEGDLVCRRDPTHKLYHPNHAKLHPWRDAIVTACKLRSVTPWPASTPVAVDLTFSVARGKTVTRDLPTTRPDLDKLVRAVLDALTAAKVLADDAQVVEVGARKRYADPAKAAPEFGDVLHAPGVVIRLYPGGDE